MDVRRLGLLRELSERGSVTAVAQALHLTPSAVSQQLKTLEREAGVALERLEVRAYGCLLEELMTCCDWSDSRVQADVAVKLASLRDGCLSEDVDKRPLFEQIASELLVLKAR